MQRFREIIVGVPVVELSTVADFKEFILSNRNALIERELIGPGSEGQTKGAPRRFNHSFPILRDGKIEQSRCPAERVADRPNGLFLVWSSDKQSAFESALDKCGFNWERFRLIAQEYRNHWPNLQQAWQTPNPVKNVNTVHFLEPFHPGITRVIDDLGRTSQFRNLCEVSAPAFLIFDWKVEEDGTRSITSTAPGKEIEDWEYLFVEGDEISKKYSKKVHVQYRACMLAARGMIEWTSRQGLFEDWGTVRCALCGEEFWPQLLSSTEISKLGFPRFCIDCCDLRKDVWHLQSQDIEVRRRNAIRGVQLAFEITNVFPTQAVKKEGIAHLSDVERDDWMIAQILLPGPSTKELFGSWNDLLAAAGLLTRAPRRGKGGYVSKSECGHICLSLAERRVCDALFSLKIEHEKEPYYPVHPELNPTGRLRGDWKVKDQFIEFAGYMGDEIYRAKIMKKQLLAATCGIELLVVLPTDLKQITPLLAARFPETTDKKTDIR